MKRRYHVIAHILNNLMFIAPHVAHSVMVIRMHGSYALCQLTVSRGQEFANGCTFVR
jgi:hypothetical protein